MSTSRKQWFGLGLAGLSLLGLAGCFEGQRSDNEESIASDRPFAYVVRDFPEMGDTPTIDVRPPLDPRDPYQFNPGAHLMVRDRIALNTSERDVMSGYFGGASYDVKDVDISPDGERIVFAAHGPASNASDNTWNIYEYTFDNGRVRRIFASDDTANLGNDTNPAYTNEGRIVFSSDRQASRGDWRLLDLREYLEDFGEPASLLHTVNPDGSGLAQISFGEFHDIEPSTMDDGHIVFIRFGRLYETLTDCTLDQVDDPNFNTHPHGGGYGQGNGNGFPSGLEDPKDWTEADKCGASLEGDTPDERIFVEDVFSLYRITPNGGNMHRYFGSLSEEFSDASFIHYMDPIPLPDGNLVTIMRHIYNPTYGGDVVKINSTNFFAVDFPVDESVVGEAEESFTPGLVNFYPNQVSPAGWYSAVAPYGDGSGRLLAAWAQCLTFSDSNIVSACEGSSTADNLGEPQYGVWMIDPGSNTRLPVVRGQRQSLYTDVVIGNRNDQARPYSGERNSLDLEDNTAVFHIRSIYDLDGADMAEPDGGIVTRRDPSLTSPDDRSERFIRVLGKRSIPADLEQLILTDPVWNPESGPRPPMGLVPMLGSGGRGLYDVLSYSLVEPDGSAMVKVPSDTEITFEVVNKYGKRVDLIAEPGYNYNYLMQHPTKLLLENGEELRCYGCHDPDVDIPHARTDVELASANPGAPGDSMPFPNANPAIVAFAWKDTMAQALTESLGYLTSTGGDTMAFEDYWGNPPDDSLAFSVSYSGLTTTSPVADASCLTDWRPDCKATINYMEHIQPIWNACRADPITSDTISCQGCHRAAESKVCGAATGGGGASTNLLLGGGNSSWDDRQPESYVQLFEPDYYLRQSADGDWVEVTDPATQCPDGIQGDMTVLPDPGVCFSRRLMSGRGAIASARFFTLFDDDPDDNAYEVELAGTAAIRQTHMGMLTKAELKLIAEWLDAGAHYYNDPDKLVFPTP